MEVSGLWQESSVDSHDGDSGARDLWTPPLTEDSQFLQAEPAPKDNNNNMHCPENNPYGTGAQRPRPASMPASVVVQNENENACVVKSAIDIKALLPSKSDGQISKGVAMVTTEETPSGQPAASSPRSMDPRDNDASGRMQRPTKRPESGDIFSTLEAELAEIERRYIEPAPAPSRPSPARTRRTSLASSWASSSGGGSAFNPPAGPSNSYPPTSPAAAAPTAPTMLELLLSSSGEPPARSRTGSQTGSQASAHASSPQAPPRHLEPSRPPNDPHVNSLTALAAALQDAPAPPPGDSELASRSQASMGGTNGVQATAAAPRQPSHARTFVSGIPSYSASGSSAPTSRRAPLNSSGAPAPQLEPWPLLPPPQTSKAAEELTAAVGAPEQANNMNPPGSPIDARVGAMASALSMRRHAAVAAPPPPSAVEMVQAQLRSSEPQSPCTDDRRANADGDGQAVRAAASWGGAPEYGVAQQKVLASLASHNDSPLQVGKRTASVAGFTEALAASAKTAPPTSLASQTLAAVEELTRAAAALSATAGASPFRDPNTSAHVSESTRSLPKEGAAAAPVPATAAASAGQPAQQQPVMPQPSLVAGAKKSLLVLLEAITKEAVSHRPLSAAPPAVPQPVPASQPQAAPESPPASEMPAASQPLVVLQHRAAPESPPVSQPQAVPESPTAVEPPTVSQQPAAPEPLPPFELTAAPESSTVSSPPTAPESPTESQSHPAPESPTVSQSHAAPESPTVSQPPTEPELLAASQLPLAAEPPPVPQPSGTLQQLAAWQAPMAAELSSASTATESSQPQSEPQSEPHSQPQSEPQLSKTASAVSISETQSTSTEEPLAVVAPPSNTVIHTHPVGQMSASPPDSRRPSSDASDTLKLDSGSVNFDSLIPTDTPFAESEAQGSWVRDLTLASNSSSSSACSDAGIAQTAEDTSHSRASADSETAAHWDAPPSSATVVEVSDGSATGDKPPPDVGTTTRPVHASQTVTRTNSHTSGGRISTSSGDSLTGLVAPVLRESLEAPGQLLTRAPMQPSMDSTHFSAFLQRLFDQGGRRSGDAAEQSAAGSGPGRTQGAEEAEEEPISPPRSVAQPGAAQEVSGLELLEGPTQPEVSAPALPAGGQEQLQGDVRVPSIDLPALEVQQVRGEKRQAEKLTDPGCRPAPVRRAVRSGRRYDVGRGLDSFNGSSSMKATAAEPEGESLLANPDNVPAATAKIVVPEADVKDVKETEDGEMGGRWVNGGSGVPEQSRTPQGNVPEETGAVDTSWPERQAPPALKIPPEPLTKEVSCLAEDVSTPLAGPEMERRLDEAASRAEAAALALLAAVELRVQMEEDLEEQDDEAWQLQLERRLGHLDLQTPTSVPSVARWEGQGAGSPSEELLRAARQAALEALQARVLDVQSRYNARRLRRRGARANGGPLDSPRSAATRPGTTTLPGAAPTRTPSAAGRYRPNSTAPHHKSPRSPTRQRPASNLAGKPAPATGIPTSRRPDATRAAAQNNTDSAQPSKGLRQILAQLTSPTSIGKKPAASEAGIPVAAPSSRGRQPGSSGAHRNLAAAPAPAAPRPAALMQPSQSLPHRKSVAPLVLPTAARSGPTVNPRHILCSTSLPPAASMQPNQIGGGLLMSWLSSPSAAPMAAPSENAPTYTAGVPDRHQADTDSSRRHNLRLVSTAGLASSSGKPSHSNSLPGSSFAPPASAAWAPRATAQEGAPWQRSSYPSCGTTAAPTSAAQPRWTPKPTSLMMSSGAHYARPPQQAQQAHPSSAHRTYSVASNSGEAPACPVMPRLAPLSSTARPSPAASPVLIGRSGSPSSAGRGRGLGADGDGLYDSAPRANLPLTSLPGEVNELRLLCALARDLPQLDSMQRVQLWERLEQLLAKKLARSPRSRSATAGGRAVESYAGDRTPQHPRRRISPRSNSPLRGYTAVWEWRQRNSSCGSGSGSRWSASGGTVDEGGTGSGAQLGRDAAAGADRAQSLLMQLLLNPAGSVGHSGSRGEALLDSTLEVVHRVIAPNATLAHAMSLNWQSAKSQAAKSGGLGGWERGLL